MDAAAVKQLTDGGIVGVLIILALWWTQRGHPRLMKTLDGFGTAAEKRQKDNEAALIGQQTIYLAQLAEQRKDFLDALKFNREHQTQDAAECRAERAVMQKHYREEREADRLARHNMASEFQKMIAETYRFGRGVRGDDPET